MPGHHPGNAGHQKMLQNHNGSAVDAGFDSYKQPRFQPGSQTPRNGGQAVPSSHSQWGWHLFSHLPTSASQGPETNVNLGAGLCRVTPGSVLLTLSPPSVWCPQKSVWFFGGYIVDQKAVMS